MKINFYEGYKKGLQYFLEDKILMVWLLVISILNSPLKANQLTIIGDIFLVIFLTAGFCGVAQNREKIEKIKFATIFIESSKYFSRVILTLISILFLSMTNFLVVFFFGILPIIISGVKVTEEYSMTMFWMMVLMVVVYRLPLFTLSFMVTINDRRENGKYALVKAKEMLWENKVFWVHSIFQFSFYMFFYYIKIRYFGANLFTYTIVDVLGAFIFLYFVLADFYIVKAILNSNEKYKTIYDRHTYKGIFDTFYGKYIM